MIRRLGRDRNGGVEADRGLGHADVIVDRLRHADQRDAALLRQAAEDGQAAVAADADQRVATQIAEIRDDLLGAVFLAAVGHRIGERVALVGRPQNGATLPHHHGIHMVRQQRPDLRRIGQQAKRAIQHADHVPAEDRRAQDHRPHDGVQSGAITAAGEQTDSFWRYRHGSRASHKGDRGPHQNGMEPRPARKDFARNCQPKRAPGGRRRGLLTET